MLKKNKPTKQTKSYAEIKQEWEKIQSLDIRNRFKAMRPLANNICEIYKNKKGDIELEQLDFFIKTLKQVNRVHNIPRCKRSLSKMIADQLELTGLSNCKIIKKLPGTINLESGSIAIGDPCYQKDITDTYSDYSEKNLLSLVNANKAYIFSTGGDGCYNIQIRIVDSLEPVLSSKEFKCVLDATETAVINIPTGLVAVADPHALDIENYRLSVNVEPGNYKVCVYFFAIPSKVEAFYIVLCKTDETAENNLTTLPVLNYH